MGARPLVSVTFAVEWAQSQLQNDRKKYSSGH